MRELWASLAMAITKKRGQRCLVGKYRIMNKHAQTVSRVVPKLNVVMGRVRGARSSTPLDRLPALWQRSIAVDGSAQLVLMT